jgi:hypothetical protein
MRRSPRPAVLVLVLAAPVVALGSCSGQQATSEFDAALPVADSGGWEASSGCHGDNECPQPDGRYCQPCFDGGTSCAAARCLNGVCTGYPPMCPGPVSNPCASKACGDPCEQCSTFDGGCYSGTCSSLGACKNSTPTCSGDGGRGCAPMDAIGIGDCNYFLGWIWDGAACKAVVGCQCIGSDCGLGLNDSSTCQTVFSGCSGGADAH